MIVIPFYIFVNKVVILHNDGWVCRQNVTGFKILDEINSAPEKFDSKKIS